MRKFANALRLIGTYLSMLSTSIFAVAVSAAQPNIVMIITDDQGIGDVSYGNLSVDLDTPHIDALAASGMVFNNFYSNSPVCSPTRASILTGRHSGRAGVPGVIRSNPVNSWGFLSPSINTLPELLQQAGYHTGHIGKWHLGLQSPNLPNERGYDYFRGYLDGSMEDYCTHEMNGVDYMRENDQPTNHAGVHATRLFTQWAVDFVNESAALEQPYFMTLWYNAPHDPVQPPNENDLSGCPIDPSVAEDRDALTKLIVDLDNQIGVLIQALKDTGTYANTLIVFASDNGGLLSVGASNGPFRGGKADIYEGGIRVPMAASWPDVIAPSQSSDTVAMTMDLFPTLLAAAGAAVPADIDGQSLLPILRQGANPLANRTLVWQRLQRERISSSFSLNRSYGLRLGDWKLIRQGVAATASGAGFELYNVSQDQDPHETTDQCATNPTKCNELQVLLDDYVRQEQLVPWRPSLPYRTLPFSAGDRIEAEDFDQYIAQDSLVGSAGAGYHDMDAANVLNANYRPGEGVDVAENASASNDHNVGNTKPGEWLAYSANIAAPGNYRVEARVAAPNPNGTFHIEFDGVDVTGPVLVPDTGGWQTWLVIETPPFYLSAGETTMRVVLDQNQQGGTSVANFDWFKLSPSIAAGPLITLTNPGNQIHVEGTSVVLQIVAGGSDGLVYTADQLPSGLTIDDSTGLVSGTASEAGSYATVVHVMDPASGEMDDTAFTWRIDPSSVTTGAFQQSSTGAKLLVMNASSFDTNSPQGGHRWSLISSSAAANGTAMQSMPDNGTSRKTGYQTNSPRLNFNANFVATGTHYLWVRGFARNTGSDSVHAGLNNGEIVTARRIDEFDSQLWGWSNTIKLSATNLQRAIIEVPSLGAHTLNLWMREDGFAIDKILLTTDPDYVPTDLGPDESSRATPGAANNVPVIVNPGAQSSTLDSRIDFEIVASDADGDVLTFSETGLPFGLNLASDGVISGVVAAAGSYPVTIRAIDGNGGVAVTSFTWTVTSSVGNGQLQGSAQQSNSSVNLTAQGESDWVKWRSRVVRKSTGGAQIGAVLLGDEAASNSGSRAIYSWTDGTPTRSRSSDKSGWRVFEVGNGFQITVPAGLDAQTLHLHVGVKQARINVAASLSDDSAPVYEDSIERNGNLQTYVIAIDYQAAGSDQELIVDLILEERFRNTRTASQIGLEAATLF